MIAFLEAKVLNIYLVCLIASNSDVKLKLVVNGFAQQQCSTVYRRAAINLSEKQLCAGGEEGKDR